MADTGQTGEHVSHISRERSTRIVDLELELTLGRAVGGLMIAGGVGSLINHSFSSIIIGVYELLYVDISL